MTLTDLPAPDRAAELAELRACAAGWSSPPGSSRTRRRHGGRSGELEAQRLKAFEEGRVDVGLRERARNATDEGRRLGEGS